MGRGEGALVVDQGRRVLTHHAGLDLADNQQVVADGPAAASPER